MKPKCRLVTAVFIITLSSGCAAMFVPLTSDPAEKLGWALELFDRQQRPLPAEGLIREAIDIYQKENNPLGLAEAYRTYGFFFRSAAIEKWHKHYKENGFLEKSATYETRYNKSLEYFEKAKGILLEYKKYDALTNIYLNMGFTYEFANNKDRACMAYEESITTNREFSRLNPNAKLTGPKGYTNYEEYVNVHRRRLGCL